MATNLSLSKRRWNLDISNFYTNLHIAMIQNDDIFNTKYPSSLDFFDYLNDYSPNYANLNILDAGCGATAVNTIVSLKQGFASVVSMDINKVSIRFAHNLLTQNEKRFNQLPHFIIASVLDTPFRPNSFDIVISSGVIHHTPNPFSALQEMIRILKPGGILFLNIYCFENSIIFYIIYLLRIIGKIIPFRLMHLLFHRIPLINNFILDHMYVPNLWVYNSSDVRKMLEKADMNIIKECPSRMDYLYGIKCLGFSLTGDGLLRVFISSKSPDINN